MCMIEILFIGKIACSYNDNKVKLLAEGNFSITNSNIKGENDNDTDFRVSN